MLNGPDCRQIRVASIRDTGAGVKFRIRLRLPLLVVGVIDALPFARSRGDKRNGNGAKRRSSRRALHSLSEPRRPFPLFSSTLVAVPSE